MQRSTVFRVCLLALFLMVALLLTVSPQGHAQEDTQTASEEAVSGSAKAPYLKLAASEHEDAVVVQSWLIVVTVVASVTALVAVAVSLYLYRWRRILLTGHPNALVPEEWGAALRDGRKATLDLISSNNQNTQTVSDFLTQHSDVVRQMTETFMTFKQSLDDKDAEIERLRQGYDAYVYRQFLNRFIRVHQSLLEQAADAEVSVADIRTLMLLLEDALEESGVAPFEPEPGEDIRALGDRIADNPRILETPDPATHLTIAEVNTPGYELVSGEQSVVLLPAQVTVYRSSNLGEEV